MATALTLALMGSGALAAQDAGAVSTSAPAAGAIGHDVSYPQCDRTLPAGGAFGIVGVTDGRAFDPPTRCLAEQYAWAKTLPHAPGVYVNTGNPGPASSRLTKTGDGAPALCLDPKSYTDPGCAYNYGWRSMEHAMKLAKAAGVATNHTWWLDVEVLNSWDGDASANAADLQGAYDYLRTKGVKEVGIYSTAFQWTEITGGYGVANAGTYKLAWAPYFAPRFAMESAPLWQAGVTGQQGKTGLQVARERCGVSFTGARVRFAQFVVDGIDHNLVCGTPKAAADPCRPGAPLPAGYNPRFGTVDADRVVGTDSKEILFGAAGADILDGAGGADILCGGSGRDDLRGGDGDDFLYGSSSSDLLKGGSGHDRLDGGTSDDTLYGESGNDRLYGADGDDRVYGGSWADRLYGQDGRDHLDGGSSTDTCSGGADPDTYKSC